MLDAHIKRAREPDIRAIEHQRYSMLGRKVAEQLELRICRAVVDHDDSGYLLQDIAQTLGKPGVGVVRDQDSAHVSSGSVVSCHR
jgi:hypothetical protein